MPNRFAPMFQKYEERIRDLEEQLETALRERDEWKQTAEDNRWLTLKARIEELEEQLDSAPADRASYQGERDGADVPNPASVPSIDSQLTDEDFEVIREDASPAIELDEPARQSIEQYGEPSSPASVSGAGGASGSADLGAHTEYQPAPETPAQSPAISPEAE